MAPSPPDFQISPIEAIEDVLLYRIVAYLEFPDILRLSTSAPILRQYLRREILEHVCVYGNSHEILRRLGTFPAQQQWGRDILEHIRKVRVILTKDTTESRHDWDNICDFHPGGNILLPTPGDMHDALRIALVHTLKSMFKMRYLDLCMAALPKDEQANISQSLEEFVELLYLRLLRVRGEFKLQSILLRLCSAPTLVALDLDTNHKSTLLKFATKKFPNLARLRLMISCEREKPSRSTNHRVVEAIGALAPQLRWLILCEGPSKHYRRRLIGETMGERQQFFNEIRLLGDTLKESMPKLRRFACTLWLERLSNGMMHGQYPADQEDHELADWEPFLSTVASKIQERANQLRDVCILIENGKYRSYEKQDSIRIMGVEDVHRTDNWPFGLASVS
ncbi:unnamed protein product [Fusarium fujikuroi]|uniref:Uncharacterized protein n=1 Tax=Fusarium fujikuroi TaxID=5127 RepID=A0A2H3S131_FUSFU|nr:Uncharacterized protein Y057_2308 [Fusarium fujikuroi]SCN76659.1 uncharacterized protein FFE2_03589 [Fusarium fujikuroi]SCN94910.1 uncharacterized protein FFC1_07169 [Fusarium fujikuroi]SCO48313.1 uncharacterized protein FFNC_12068 [Fusarium fujikuroi]SCV30990.1 uncharacterized protein FFFS_02656 [Fusarium fujikuroi]